MHKVLIAFDRLRVDAVTNIEVTKQSQEVSFHSDIHEKSKYIAIKIEPSC